MPHSDKSPRAQRRALKRTIEREGARARTRLYLRRERMKRRVEEQRARYARLSVERLVQLGERHGLVEDAPEEPTTNEGMDPALD